MAAISVPTRGRSGSVAHRMSAPVAAAAACTALLLLLLLLSGVQAGGLYRGLSAPGAAPPPSNASLEYYVQVVVGAPYTGVLVGALDAASTYSFGSVEAFNFNITAGASNASQPLGSVMGYTVQASYTSASHEVEVEVVSYDDGAGRNGTLSLQGLVNLATNEIAIAGGSGAFRGARGYVVITMINPAVYHHSLYFL